MSNPLSNNEKYPFELPKLPYAKNALEPYVTEKTFDFHYGKHHQTYVTNLNNLVKDTDLTSKSLEEIIMLSYKDYSKSGLFSNAAQVWNHTFFWHCMKPMGGGEPKAKLRDKIDQTFGSYTKFKDEFKQAGLTQFGSGWAWLVLENDNLKITKTPNADLPMVHNQRAIITADVWEHAYYLDYQNRRIDYLEIFLNNLVNWDFAEKNFNL